MSIKSLWLASIGYLMIPNIVFFQYWTIWPVALVGIAILGYCFFRQIKNRHAALSAQLGATDLLKIIGAALLLTVVSGICGLAYQTFDHWCHNVKFYELLQYSWPIRIPQDGAVVSYYYGFYVVPALLSKLVGGISETAIFLWTLLGFALGMAWLYIVLNKKMLFALLALTIGDTPHVIKTVVFKLGLQPYVFGDFGIENWSNFENLLWVPNQVIPTLIVGGMLVYILSKEIELEYIVLPIALTFWWAVFPALTLGLLGAVLLIVKWLRLGLRLDWSEIFTRVVLPSLACVPIFLLYLSHEESPIAGLVWEYSTDTLNLFKEYAINIVINAVVFAAVYAFFKTRKPSALPELPFYLILLFTLLFPIYRMGKVNDFLFRGMMPYLIIAGLYLFYPLAQFDTYRTFYKYLRSSAVGVFLFLVLTSSSYIAIGRVVRAARVNLMTNELLPQYSDFRPIPYDEYANIYEVLKDKWSQREADQYLGKKDSFYEENLAPE